MTSRLWAAAAGLVALMAPTTASGSGSISVSTEGCPLKSTELERLVRLELTSVLGPTTVGSYEVSVRCREGGIDVSIFDPLTTKRLERTVAPPPPNQPEPERVLALTIAQLYRAAWLELATEDPPPLPPVTKTRPSAAEVEAAKTIAEGRLADEADQPLPWSVGLIGGLSVRRLQVPLVMPSIELDATWAPTGKLFWLLAHGGVEWASVARDNGTVSTVLVRAGGGVGMEPLVSGIWSGFSELTAGVGWLRTAGEDVARGYRASVISGAGFDGSFSLGAAARVGPIRFEILGRVGVLVGTPTALVAGDEELSLDGPWAGGGVRLRWLL